MEAEPRRPEPRASETPLARARVGIIADSLALPRPPELGSVPFYETYPHLLEARLEASPSARGARVLLNARRARLMRDATGELTEALWNGADGVVIHLGICDCGPRVLSSAMHFVVDRVRPLSVRKVIIDQISRHRRGIMLRTGGSVYTSQRAFRKHTAAVARALADARLRLACFVNVAPPDERMEHRSPGYRENVIAYNAILSEEAAKRNIGVIDLFSEIEARGGMERLGLDGQHLNAEGAALLSELLFARVQSAYS